MKDNAAIRLNYIKDKYMVMVQNSIDSQLKCES